MPTTRVVLVIRFIAGLGGFVSLVGLCSVLAGAVSESADGTAVGWVFAAVGALVLVISVLALMSVTASDHGSQK